MVRYPVAEDVAAGSEERTGQTSARVIRSIPELEDLRSTWVSWQHHPNSDIDFYLTILGTRPEIVRPHIIVVYRGGRPDAMLIGRLEHRRFDLKIGYKAFLSPRCRSLTFIYEGLLGNGSPENSRVMLDEIMTSLRRGEADVAFFNSLKVDSPLFCSARTSPGFLSRDYSPDRREHWAMKLPRTFQEYYLSLSPRVRKNRRHEANMLNRKYSNNVKVTCVRAADEIDQLIPDLEGIASRTYHRGLGVGFEDSDEMRRRLLLDARQGRLRAYVLYVADKPSAFWLATLYGGTLHGRFTGYLPELAKYSPGTLILLKVIEDSCSSGVREIDFGLGDAWYKGVFCNDSWQEASLFVFGSSPRGLGLSLLRTPITALDRVGRSALRQVAVLARVKRAWRNMLRPGEGRQPPQGAKP